MQNRKSNPKADRPRDLTYSLHKPDCPCLCYHMLSLVQIMTYCLIGAKPLSEPMLKLQWNFYRNSYIVTQENAFENVVCKMASILSQPQCVVNCASSGTQVGILEYMNTRSVVLFSGTVESDGWDQGWGLLSRFPPFRYFPNFSTLPKYMLAIEYHVHIWQVLPQLSCGDTCQIWIWFKDFKRYFCEIENFAYG